MAKWFNVAALLLALGGLVACTVPVDDAPTPQEPPLELAPPLDPASVLPSFSPAELQRQREEMTIRVQADLDMVGLGKIGQVGFPFPPELTAFREAWAEVDPATAPFLGTWIRDWDLMPHYYLTVLPSRVPGQVCLVHYLQEETTTVPFEVITTPVVMSPALVSDNQLRSADTRSATILLEDNATLSYPVEFLGTVVGDRFRLHAAQRPPEISGEWDAALVQQLAAYQCTDALP